MRLCAGNGRKAGPLFPPLPSVQTGVQVSCTLLHSVPETPGGKGLCKISNLPHKKFSLPERGSEEGPLAMGQAQPRRGACHRPMAKTIALLMAYTVPSPPTTVGV